MHQLDQYARIFDFGDGESKYFKRLCCTLHQLTFSHLKPTYTQIMLLDSRELLCDSAVRRRW